MVCVFISVTQVAEHVGAAYWGVSLHVDGTVSHVTHVLSLRATVNITASDTIWFALDTPYRTAKLSWK
jgi:hypothetical protein